MGDFTSFGAKIWRWRRWRNLDDSTRLLWVGLYTTLHAKRMVPGLWNGSIAIMVEETGMTPERVITGIDRLLEVDLIEYDRDHNVVRMTELPDAGEWPGANANWIKGWWNRFVLVPQCPIRDAHVTTLRWILDQGARDRGTLVSAKVEQAWLETFGRIEIPAQRRRGVTRLTGDSDTSTSVQPSLFSISNTPELPTVPRPSPEHDVPSARSNVADTTVPSETVSEATSEPWVDRGSIDPRRPSGTGTGTGTGISSPGGIGGLSTGWLSTARPVLTLVPPPGAFTVADLHGAMKPTGARWPTVLVERDQLALAHAIGDLGTMFDGAAVIALLREHIACGGMGGITPAEICRPGALSAAIQKAQERKRTAEERAAMLATVLQG